MAVLQAVRSKIFRMVQNALRTGDSEPFDLEASERGDRYKLNEALYDNSIYDTRSAGGYRETILKEVFGIEADETIRLLGYVNPTKQIVQCYQNCLRGSFGKEIKVADKVDDEAVNPALLTTGRSNPIRKIWNWSNLDTNKQTVQIWAANLGCVGIRIVAANDPDPAKRRVSLQFDHPRTIWDFDQNDRDDVVEVELRWKALTGELGEKRDEVEVREVFSKTRLLREIDGTIVFDEPNELGVCPYVILRHGEVQQEFGRWAYAGAEQKIHTLNWILSNFGDSIYEHLWPTWFGANAGDKPQSLAVGRKQMVWTKLVPDSPDPVFQPMVAEVDFGGALAFCVFLLDALIEAQPEIILGHIKALSGQSGETIAKLLMAVEARITQATANYENPLIRAIKIGLSEGIRMGIWNLGTGTGSAMAAERAFGNGLEDFAFVDRPPLPQTIFDKLNQVKLEDAPKMSKLTLAKTANGLPISDREELRLAGYTKDEIDQIMEERATQDVIPTEDDGGEPGANDGNDAGA